MAPPDNGSETIVYASRKKALGIFAGCLLFVGLGVMLFFDRAVIQDNLSELGFGYVAGGAVGIGWRLFRSARRTGAPSTIAKTVAALVTFGSVAFIVLGLFLVFRPFSSSVIDDVAVTAFLVSAVSIGLFGAVNNLRLLIARPVVLVVNGQGIFDHGATIPSKGLIRWEDVERVHVAPMGDIEYLCVLPRDAKPVYIPDVNLEISMDELVEHVEIFHPVERPVED